jgi:hypothetical protein
LFSVCAQILHTGLAQPGFGLSKAARGLFSLAAGQDLAADPGLADPGLADPVRASAPVLGSAAADSGAQAVVLPAAGVVEEAGADAAADLDAQPAAWAGAVAAAVDAAAVADASSNRGAHTKGDLHSSVPNSRRD